ncbi:extracellular substrate-binding orphan/ GRRM family protein [Synechococcus sp. A15-62]|uniref:extracellular substrate binding-like orphan protein GrrP n=1 Tax=Synechococcus sp. A15-62 TaxID=1050657 RepID=UPI001645A663|nr:extracellular substrate binding-like orphan protein GrrP [Synechococcus sp. A15-62]QNJ01037.1 extracellular substrate-binding orphan/ GRRM family protein [Synechococcus sp. A15-62]
MIFEEVKPLYQKTDAGYEGLGVDVLEQIRIQAKRRKVDYRVAKSVNDGIGAVITGRADIACGVAFTWGRSSQVSYSLPFGVGGTRLLMARDTTIDGTPASLEGQTIGVVKDTASAKVLKSVVPGATLFSIPKEALDAFYTGDVSILGGGTLWLAANQPDRQDGAAALPSLRPLRHQLHHQSKQRQTALLHQHRVGPDDAGLHGW